MVTIETKSVIILSIKRLGGVKFRNMSKPTTIKDAIKKWEEKHPGQNIGEAKEVAFQFQFPPIEKMDNSLSILTNCQFVLKLGKGEGNLYCFGIFSGSSA